MLGDENECAKHRAKWAPGVLFYPAPYVGRLGNTPFGPQNGRQASALR